MGDEMVTTLEVNGNTYDIYGLFDEETPEGQFDSYDIWWRGPGGDAQLVNAGDTWFEFPTAEAIQCYLKDNPDER